MCSLVSVPTEKRSGNLQSSGNEYSIALCEDGTQQVLNQVTRGSQQIADA